MKCDQVKDLIPLFLYGELSFDEEDGFEAHVDECAACRETLARERRFHRALNAQELTPAPELLARCRQDLERNLTSAGRPHGSWWGRVRDAFTIRPAALPGGWQAAAAMALVAFGFFSARWIPYSIPGGPQMASLGEPLTSRVRYVEPQASGRIQIVVDETRQHTLSGSLEDEPIRRLLLAAAKDPADPGLRVESVELLKSTPQSADIRTALLYALQHDSNAGVRLKALEGLKGSAADPEVRQALTRVLLSDKNPGVRTQVIDLLTEHKEDRMVPVLQELIRKEDNGYVRLRCQKALREMNASVETF
jgi:hypothetical protein